MIRIDVIDFNDWRKHARNLLSTAVPPEQVEWCEADQLQHSLLCESFQSAPSVLEQRYSVPRSFLALAQTVVCHRHPEKWALLYTLLWRLTLSNEKNLLKITSDPLVHRLRLMQKAVRRDVHKMHAFVRFQSHKLGGNTFFSAWYEPDHKILRLAAPFFEERFRVQTWLIFTPEGMVAWNGKSLYFNENKMCKISLGNHDEIEPLWQTYYRAIFNPARIKIKAMKKEMPVRFWKNLREAQLIPNLLQEAPKRVAEMLRLSGIDT